MEKIAILTVMRFTFNPDFTKKVSIKYVYYGKIFKDIFKGGRVILIFSRGK